MNLHTDSAVSFFLEGLMLVERMAPVIPALSSTADQVVNDAKTVIEHVKAHDVDATFADVAKGLGHLQVGWGALSKALNLSQHHQI